MGALETTVYPGLDITFLHLDFGTHLLQAVQVQVYGAGTNGAATRQRHISSAEAGEQRSQNQN